MKGISTFTVSFRACSQTRFSGVNPVPPTATDTPAHHSFLHTDRVKRMHLNYQSHYSVFCIPYFLLITTLAVNTAYFREGTIQLPAQTFESFLSRKTAGLEQTMRKTMAKILLTAGNPPLKLNDFKDGRGKMGLEKQAVFKTRMLLHGPTRLTSL